jgi:signal transduction histidine kinase/CheY-like chemotaxis protein
VLVRVGRADMSRTTRRLIGIVSLLTCAWGQAHAQGAGAAHWTPRSVAAAIEAKAAATSFKQLEQFGQDSLKASVPTPERLNRLYHVGWIILNQSDFKRFDYWNTLLAQQAAAAHDHRFEVVAQLDGLRSRSDQGDAGAIDTIRKIANTEPDWFARAHAMRLVAIYMIQDEQAGAALRVLAEAESLVPENDPMANMARSGIWEIEGLALMQIHDLRGSAMAFGRSQFEFGSPGYPRPDFDGIYNMASLATQLGDQPLAENLAGVHHRLVQRSDVAGLGVWDAYLCAAVAERVSPQRVLACVAPLGPDLEKMKILAPRLLSERAIAYARMGDVAAAERDLETLHRLAAGKSAASVQFERVPLVEAAVLRAKGDEAAAYDKLLAYSNERAERMAQRFSAGIGQVTDEMQRQLGVRREQLVTARRNVALQNDVIATQKLLEVAGAAVAAGVFALLLWQWRVAGQLRRARQAADAANRAKSEFLANMSHEIRTPLNGVVAVADMLSRADLPPKEREMAEIIRASGDTLQRLLSDILDVARIEAGQITIESAAFHVGDMVRSVAALSQLKCDEKGVRLVVEVAPELDHTVMGDLVRVRQVVTNLLSNAVKFTERGEVRLSVGRTASGAARFTVEDTGVGFDMADKAKVLGRFQQADSSITRRFGGTGLGLAICCDLATRMGGMLDCDSTPGQGSRFWMELPLEAAAVEAAAEAETAAEMSEALRILLADDHPTNRKVVELMLEGAAADLTCVEDGQQALDMFRSHRFDLILMDMQMPVMDGVTCIREIRALELAGDAERTPIVMLTANALPEHVSQAMAAGADLYLAKPFTASALFDTIAACFPAPAEEAEIAA